MKYRKVSNNFYISTASGFKKVKGFKIEDEDFDLFFHKKESGQIAISEGKSGALLSRSHSKLSTAKMFVERIKDKKGVGEINRAIEKSIKTKGLSPRYRSIVNPTKQTNVAT